MRLLVLPRELITWRFRWMIPVLFIALLAVCSQPAEARERDHLTAAGASTAGEESARILASGPPICRSGEDLEDEPSALIQRRDPFDIILATTSRMGTDTAFGEMIDSYISTVSTFSGLDATYVVLDSEECLTAYGARVVSPGNWRDIRDVLHVILQATGAHYVILLGSAYAVPRPSVELTTGAKARAYVSSDAWFVDFDEDRIVDEGLAIGRMPDLFVSSEAVVSCLATAIELHQNGGCTIDNEIRFTMNDYATPPYGVCTSCYLRSEFFDLLSANDYLLFAGHGDPYGFYNNSFQPIFTTSYMDSVDFQSHHPLIIGYYSCLAGVLNSNNPTLSSEFLKAGASAYVSRTTTEGVPNHVAENFKEAILAGERIGSALFRLMRETVFMYGDDFKIAAGHLVLYGDPTLKRREITATHLAYFRTEWLDSRARLTWKVVTEPAGNEFQAWRIDPDGQRMRIGDLLSVEQGEFEVVDPAPPGNGAEYRLQEIDSAGRSYWHGPSMLSPRRAVPPRPSLTAGWPNPFNPHTTLGYALPKSGQVRLSIHDLKGRLVTTLIDGVRAAGEHSIGWDGRGDEGTMAASGIYVVTLETAEGLASRKIILAR